MAGNEAIKNLSIYVPLYQVALKGDWEKAKKFIALHPAALSARITKGRDTVLHITVGAKQTKFVEELVYLMDARDLELKNNDNNTTLCFTYPLNEALCEYEASLVSKLHFLFYKKPKHSSYDRWTHPNKYA